MSDIEALSERHEFEHVLRKARGDYRALVEQIPAVLYTDTPGQERHTLYVSPHIEQVLGITPREFVENNNVWVAMLHPDDRDRVLGEYEEFLRGGPDVEDYRMVRPDGRIVWIRDRGKIIRDDANGLLLEQGIMFDVTELKEAQEIITRQVELLKKVDMIGRDFTGLVLRSAGLRRILDGLANIAGNPVVLEDSAHHPVEFAGPEEALERMFGDWQAHSRVGHDEQKQGLARGEGKQRCVWIPICLHDEPWGRLHLLEAGRTIDEVDMLALDRAAAAVGLSLLSERDTASLAEQAGSALVFDILQGRYTSSKEILRRARALGADLDGRVLACLAIELRGFADPAAELGVRKGDRRRLRGEVLGGVRAVVAAAGCTGLSALDGARVLAIIGVPDGKQSRDVLAGIGREAGRRMEPLGVGAVVGATDRVSPDSLQRGLEDALEAAAFGVRAGGGVHFFGDLGVHHLLARLSEGPELARFVESALKPMLDHDARTSSPLVPTLRAYLDHGGGKSATARHLHIDRRTLYHRLERIERTLCRDLDDQQTRMDLTFALRGLDLLTLPHRQEPPPRPTGRSFA